MEYREQELAIGLLSKSTCLLNADYQLILYSSGHAHLDRQGYDMACLELASDVAENFGYVSCTECIFHGNDFDLIHTVTNSIMWNADNTVFGWKAICA